MAAVTMSDVEVREDLRGFSRHWWIFLVAGILWVLISFVILAARPASVGLIALAVGLVLLLAGVEEAAHTFLLPGWRWVHALLALLFLAGGILALVYPGQTFATLALFLAFFLIVKGIFDLIVGIAGHGTHLWWLVMLTGIAEIFIGFWAVGYPGRSAVLLILWAGLGALFRGIGQIMTAFEVRHLAKEIG